MHTMDTILAICAGIGLAAACGFRVFVPLLVAAMATRLGYLQPSASMAWIGGTTSIVVLSVATVLEIVAYYVPWLDNLLDGIASPMAVTAGAFVAATAMGNMDPAIKWASAIIAGGGLAAGIQGATVAARAVSTATTGGIGNHIVSTIEAIGAVVLALLAVLLPVLALLLSVVLIYVLVRILNRLRGRSTAAVTTAEIG